MATILCIDPGEARGEVLERTLANAGHKTLHVSGLSAALEVLDAHALDLVIAEFRLADGTALDLLARLRELGSDLPVLVTTAYAGTEDALLALRHGAHDYLTRPLRAESLRLAVSHALEVARLRRENREFRREIDSLGGGWAIVGDSPRLREVMEVLARVAGDGSLVLLEGERGTGKQLFAHALHEMGPRRDRPLVTVNCAALAPDEAEGALFGPERAFGWPAASGQGAVERAGRGSLLLGEIAALPLPLQPRLLDTLERPADRQAGADGAPHPGPRLIATTSRDLAAETHAGRFDAGLARGLAAHVIHTPPLRERPGDIPVLLDHFVRLASARLGVRPPEVAPEAVPFLQSRDWPGNVRELANAVERAIILGHGGLLTPALFAAPGAVAERGGDRPSRGAKPDTEPAAPEVLSLRELERRAIRHALLATRGHRGRAAELLGISERTLRNRISESPELAVPSRQGSRSG